MHRASAIYIIHLFLVTLPINGMFTRLLNPIFKYAVTKKCSAPSFFQHNRSTYITRSYARNYNTIQPKQHASEKNKQHNWHNWSGGHDSGSNNDTHNKQWHIPYITTAGICAAVNFSQQYKTENNKPDNTTAEAVVVKQKTRGLYFGDDWSEGIEWDKASVKHNFIKAICSQASHIFITPRIWDAYIKARANYLKPLKAIGISEPTKQVEIKNRYMYKKEQPDEGRLKKILNAVLDLNCIGHVHQFKGLTHHKGIPELFCFDPDAWELYNTHIGLYYLHKKGAPTDGIQLQRFSRINKPFKPQQSPIKQKKFNHWTEAVNYLFDIKAWQNYRHQTSCKIFACMDGHGSKSTKHYRSRDKQFAYFLRYLNGTDTYTVACGIPDHHFAHLLTFLSDNLQIDLLGIQSCNWTAQRVLELMNNIKKKERLNFSILTIINKERPVYMDHLAPINTYCPDTKQITFSTSKHTFYKAMEKITEQYDNHLTPDIKKIIGNIAIYKKEMMDQQASFIPAGHTVPQYIPYHEDKM